MGEDTDFRVSIITPVYNAAEFVTRAVESALAQPETAEVLVIEDGSPDNSLEVCRALADKYEKVKLLRHPNGENRGAGASRNLGMKNASCDYIGFVDADDFYLPGRFRSTKQVFHEDSSCEGVYEAAGMHVEDPEAFKRWTLAGKSKNQVQTVSAAIEPDQLFSALLSGKYGYFILDSLVIKKDSQKNAGYMNETLRLHQDTEFILRLAITCRLCAGNIREPVAMWQIHDHNRITAKKTLKQDYKNRMDFWLSLYRWTKANASYEHQNAVRQSIIQFNKVHKYFRKFPREYFPAILIWITRLSRLLRYPEIVIDHIKNIRVRS